MAGRSSRKYVNPNDCLAPNTALLSSCFIFMNLMTVKAFQRVHAALESSYPTFYILHLSSSAAVLQVPVQALPVVEMAVAAADKTAFVAVYTVAAVEIVAVVAVVHTG